MPPKTLKGDFKVSPDQYRNLVATAKRVDMVLDKEKAISRKETKLREERTRLEEERKLPIKEQMERQAVEELICGPYIVRYSTVLSNRFDATTFKRLYADLYKDFTKQVSSRRFTVSC